MYNIYGKYLWLETDDKELAEECKKQGLKVIWKTI